MFLYYLSKNNRTNIKIFLYLNKEMSVNSFHHE
nr:hypothetical protein [Mucilaginibacter sp. FT3.2]